MNYLKEIYNNLDMGTRVAVIFLIFSSIFQLLYGNLLEASIAVLMTLLVISCCYYEHEIKLLKRDVFRLKIALVEVIKNDKGVQWLKDRGWFNE